MVVEHVNNDGEWPAIQKKAGAQRLLVVDFYADWCGPCRMIAPHFENLSNQYKDAVFVKVNVDNCAMVSRMYNVRAMPTFVLFVNGQEVGRSQGANTRALETLVQQHYKPIQPAKVNPRLANDEERRFLHSSLVCLVEKVLQYEDEINQTLALSVIPLEELKEKVKNSPGDVLGIPLAKALMAWFHDEFFHWMDKPECVTCMKKTTFIESTTPTVNEKQRGADRVEVYNCLDCHQNYRFARFNNPATLIETREGRCGEWANCFALCCRAAGLETRYVTCTEDHAWVEVFDSESQSWIHLDPCENVIDQPLLYEKGWKKTINYVFAVAKDNAQDVTWRYTFHHKQTLQRRKAVRELVLLNCLTKLNQRLQKELSEERRSELRHRQLREAIHLLNPKLSLREGAEQGRKSGGLSWKLARMEMHHKPVEINLTSAEKEAKLFVFEYDIVRDAYYRPMNKDEESRGLFTYLNQANNIQRKLEKDWKVVYLCRNEDTKSGDISWRVNLDGIKAKHLRLNIGKISLFHSGKASATLCGGNLCQMIDDDGILETTDLEGADHLELSINFRGGDGDNAFQHAQIFRTALCEPSISLRIELELE